MKKRGRLSTLAHNYFFEIPETTDAKCTILKDNGEPCNVVVKGGHRYGNNLKVHLSSYHPEERKIVDEKDAPVKPKITSSEQPKITQFGITSKNFIC